MRVEGVVLGLGLGFGGLVASRFSLAGAASV